MQRYGDPFTLLNGTFDDNFSLLYCLYYLTSINSLTFSFAQEWQ